ncbi:MAG: DeoR/GlpR transcriptional regulator [Cytophagales bacterium]|nr:DeoR/GlpR transcriptional regulator [Armatimonadota bacterium]
MFVEERQQRILQRLREQGKVTVEELMGDFGVSAPTVRADLAALETRRLLRRTHGGALPPATSLYEPTYAERVGTQPGEKRRIGKAAARLVRPGETVILDAGTTAHEVGVALAARGISGVTVVTNNLPTAVALMEAPGIEVIVIGGLAHLHRRAMLGPLAADFLHRVHADRVFLGANGVDAQVGLTVVDFDAALVKRAMIAHAAEVVVIADSTKICQVAFAQVAPVSVVTCLITDDASLDESVEAALLDAGVGLIERV